MSSATDDAPTTEEIAELFRMSPADLVQTVRLNSPVTAAELIEREHTVGMEHEEEVQAWLDGLDPHTIAERLESNDGPATEEIAERLGVDRNQLIQYVSYHPNPTANYILGWARAGPRHEPAVARWLNKFKAETTTEIDGEISPDDGRRGRLVQ